MQNFCTQACLEIASGVNLKMIYFSQQPKKYGVQMLTFADGVTLVQT